MTVIELINELKKHPQNLEVITNNIFPNKETEFVNATFINEDGYTVLSTCLK